jgi:hypothetical protein
MEMKLLWPARTRNFHQTWRIPLGRMAHPPTGEKEAVPAGWPPFAESRIHGHQRRPGSGLALLGSLALTSLLLA